MEHKKNIQLNSQNKGRNIMLKKIVSIILLMTLVIFCYPSCGSSQNTIVGKWSNNIETVEFKKDGSFSASYYWLGGSYEIEGNSIKLASALTGNETYTYDISGDTLTFYNSSGSVKYQFSKVK